MMEIRRTDLCDVCRQHFAIHRFIESEMGHSRYRDTILLSTCLETAAVMKITFGNVKLRHFRAIQKLRRALGCNQ
jgi:hypothetical protein